MDKSILCACLEKVKVTAGYFNPGIEWDNYRNLWIIHLKLMSIFFLTTLMSYWLYGACSEHAWPRIMLRLMPTHCLLAWSGVSWWPLSVQMSPAKRCVTSDDAVADRADGIIGLSLFLLFCLVLAESGRVCKWPSLCYNLLPWRLYMFLLSSSSCGHVFICICGVPVSWSACKCVRSSSFARAQVCTPFTSMSKII